MSDAHRWKIYDPVLDVELTMFLNPREADLPELKKTITFEPTPHSDGRVIMFEGADDPATFRWSGVTLTLAQLQFLENIYKKRYQVRFTDDFDRVWWIYPTRLAASRPRTSVNKPERHEYTLEWVVLDWPDP